MTRNSTDENCLQCFFRLLHRPIIDNHFDFRISDGEYNCGLVIQQRPDRHLTRLPFVFKHAHERFDTGDLKEKYVHPTGSDTASCSCDL